MIKSRFALTALFSYMIIASAYCQTEQISLEDIWKTYSFSAKTVSGIRSMNDGVHYTSLVSTNNGKAIVKFQYKSGKAVDTLFISGRFNTSGQGPLKVADYEFNVDESKLLIATDQESIYRRSSKSNYYAYDIPTKNLLAITDFKKGKQQLATFSPKENKVAFVRDNNIVVSDLETKTETEITTDGEWGSIINGAVDWVYEEEFSFHKGFYWSPEGTKIAYYHSDESAVKEYQLEYYGPLYPNLYDYKYPKAGESNSIVNIRVYDMGSGKTTQVDLGGDNDQYIPRIKWTQNDNVLALMKLNRLQNHLEILTASYAPDDRQMKTRVVYAEYAETYIDINDNLLFLKDGKHFIINSEKDGWNHIYMYNLQGKEIAQLTNGDWEVIEFYGVDEKSKKVYFSAAVSNTIGEEVYSVSYAPAERIYNESNKPYKPTDNKSLKNLTPNGNTNNAKFSASYDYFINFESSAASPPDIALYNAAGKKVRELESNEVLRESLKAYNLNEKEFGTYTTENGDELNYWMIKPANFDSTKSYPTMFMIYGGPGSNTVTNSWGGFNYFWHQMLAQQGYVIISVDPRGTMRKGRDFKHSTYLELGKLETEDMIDAAQHFGSMNYIDQERIGIMGWSYGGYMSSLCVTKGAEYFKLGIAVAPVTNWRYYDSIYTERFMRTPQENASGYDDNSPINHVDKLKGSYLLVHGAADDNVHYQNSMDMITALVEADKQFDLFIYPNKNHGIYGGNTRFHLYTKMTNFIKENL